MRSSARLALVLLLLLPYLIWLQRIPAWSLPAPGEWLPSLLHAVFQAALSALSSLLFGFILFVAAQGWTTPRARRWTELALLLPNMIPPLFLVLGLLSWLAPFPYGLGAVIVAHVLLNAGLVAVALDRLLHAKMGGMAETAWILGGSRRAFWRRIAWPYLRADVASLFLLVFSLCLTSFSIPLVLGGQRLVTLEVTIFEVIRSEGRWDKALLFAALQSLFLFMLAWSLPRPFAPGTQVSRRHLPFLSVRGLSGLVFLPAFILLVGWVIGVSQALQVGNMLSEIPLFEAVISSLVLGLSVGLLHLMLFLWLALVFPNPWLERFLSGYLAPSPTITGFAMLLLPDNGEIINLLKLTVALTLISFPLLCRWMVHSALNSLRQQISVARVLGATWPAVAFEIVWPQLAPQLMRASGLAALWASGDFAISGIVTSQWQTLPLLMNELIGSYRLEAAQLLLLPLMLVGLSLYALFVGATRYVTH